MYFSRVRLDPSSTDSMQILKELRSGYKEHQIVWQLFENEKDTKRDFLFRRFDLGKMPQYFILSQRKPVMNESIWEIQTAEYNPVIKNGDQFSFQLRVNPVVTKKIEGAKNPKSRKHDDIVMEARAKIKKSGETMPSNNELITKTGIEWLIGRAANHGFLTDKNQIIVEQYLQIQGEKNKGGHQIKLGIMDFSGILRVTDPEKFREALFNGIGRAKAFGCGLLLIKRI